MLTMLYEGENLDGVHSRGVLLGLIPGQRQNGVTWWNAHSWWTETERAASSLLSHFLDTRDLSLVNAATPRFSRERAGTCRDRVHGRHDLYNK